MGCAYTVLLLSVIVVSMRSNEVSGQTSASELATLLQSLRSLYPGCNVGVLNVGSISNERNIRSDVECEFATFVSYTVSGCEGGNNWTSYFGLFRSDNEKLSPLNGGPLNFPEMAAPSFGKHSISLDTFEYGPNDPHCCPSIQKTLKITFAGSNMYISASPSRRRRSTE